MQERYILSEEVNISELQEVLQEKRVTSKELVLQYLERIAKFDKAGPTINSVLEINPEAIHIAEALDEERQRKGVRGPLHGIPILIKDNIDTGDKMHTSAGSLALAGHYAKKDAFIVQKLREAGAIILGKTNMTEFANFMAYDMPAGYSSRGGQVQNPYGRGKFHPGGSSSGSGAAVACNFCAAAVGTETSGSILSPASQNSIVGIKPTLGLISRSGIIPIAHSQDTAGPMARSVYDAALLLGALTGVDEEDPITRTSKGKKQEDYTVFLDPQGLQHARIGVSRAYYEELSPLQKSIMENVIKVLEKQGATIIDPIVIEAQEKFDNIHVLVHEFKCDLNAYLATVEPELKVRDLKELIAYNATQSEQCLTYGQGLLEEAEKTSGTLTEPVYLLSKINDLELSQEKGIDAVLEKYELDAILFPSNFGCNIAARAGYPSVIIPAGYGEEGEPFGITFTAGAYSEPTLLKFAYAYEQATKMRKMPTLEEVK